MFQREIHTSTVGLRTVSCRDTVSIVAMCSVSEQGTLFLLRAVFNTATIESYLDVWLLSHQATPLTTLPVHEVQSTIGILGWLGNKTLCVCEREPLLCDRPHTGLMYYSWTQLPLANSNLHTIRGCQACWHWELTKGWSFLQAFLSSLSLPTAIPDMLALCKMEQTRTVNYSYSAMFGTTVALTSSKLCST